MHGRARIGTQISLTPESKPSTKYLLLLLTFIVVVLGKCNSSAHWSCHLYADFPDEETEFPMEEDTVGKAAWV